MKHYVPACSDIIRCRHQLQGRLLDSWTWHTERFCSTCTKNLSLPYNDSPTSDPRPILEWGEARARLHTLRALEDWHKTAESMSTSQLAVYSIPGNNGL